MIEVVQYVVKEQFFRNLCFYNLLPILNVLLQLNEKISTTKLNVSHR